MTAIGNCIRKADDVAKARMEGNRRDSERGSPQLYKSARNTAVATLRTVQDDSSLGNVY